MTWYRAGTWTHKLGANAKIGLVSMARPTDPMDTTVYTAHFEHVRVYELKQ
jgi:arabinan endo-1,5-alpha-L-arabinosidase